MVTSTWSYRIRFHRALNLILFISGESYILLAIPRNGLHVCLCRICPPRRIQDSAEFERTFILPKHDQISMYLDPDEIPLWAFKDAVYEINLNFKKKTNRTNRVNWNQGLYYTCAQYLFDTPIQKTPWERRRLSLFT